MFNKNNIIAGILFGSVLPLTACLLRHYFKNNYYLSIRPALPFFIAIAVNLLLLRSCFKKNEDQLAKGIMLVTFAFMIAILAFKIYPLR